MLLLAALTGLVGGVAMATFAGARRTSTSFDRMIEAVDGWDVLVNPDQGTETALDLDAVAALPQVTALSRAAGVPVFLLNPDGTPALDSPTFAVAAMDRTSLRGHHRPLLRDGRLPDPGRPEELLLGPVVAADLGVGAGDEVELGFIPLSELDESDPPDELPVEAMTFVVAGVGVDQANIVVDEAFADEAIVLTTAFYDAHAADAYFLAVLVTLRAGAADLPAFRTSVEALAPGEPIEFQTLDRITDTVDRAVRPQVVALTLFGLVVGITGALVLAQALTRQLAVDGADADALASIGMTRRQRLAVSVARVLIVAAVGAVLAVAVAIALSGRFPIGPARVAEPSPGLDADGWSLLVGALLVPVVLVVLLAVPLWRASRFGSSARAARPSAIAGRLASAGAGRFRWSVCGWPSVPSC